MIGVTWLALTDSPKLERMSEIVAHINGEYYSLDLFLYIIGEFGAFFECLTTDVPFEESK